MDNKSLPKIIDFGLAKATAQRLDRQNHVHRARRDGGDAGYMSPEQADQREQNIDTRTDVYSLGVILYAIAGRRSSIRREGSAQNRRLEAILRKFARRNHRSPAPRFAHGRRLRHFGENRKEEPRSFAQHLRTESSTGSP